jgi:hypothetical protein
VTRNDDQEFQDAPFEQPGDEPGYDRWGVPVIEVKEDGPEQPECAPKGQDQIGQEILIIVKKAFGEIVEELEEFVAAQCDTQGPDYGRGEEGGKERDDGA